MTYSLRQHFHLVTALALCFIMFGWLQNIQNRSLLPSFCKAKDTSTAYLHTSCPQNGDLLRSQGHRHPIPGVVFDHMMQFDIQGDRYIGLPLHTVSLFSSLVIYLIIANLGTLASCFLSYHWSSSMTPIQS